MDEPLVSTLAHLQAGVFTCAAAGTVVAYDILLTTADEVRFTWPSKLSLPKCLYFVNRYFPVPYLALGMCYLAGFRKEVSTDFCRVLALSQQVGQQISLTVGTWLLVIRVAALYGQNKLVVNVLYGLFICTHIVSTTLSIFTAYDVWGRLQYSSVVGICVAGPGDLLGPTHFTPVLCEIAMVVMQIVHAYRHSRHLESFSHPISPLLRTLYVDGFIYFVVVVTLRLWSSLTFIFADPSYWYLSPYLESSLTSISVSRLVLHLREAAEIHRSHHLSFSTAVTVSHPAISVSVPVSVSVSDHPRFSHRPARDSGRYASSHSSSLPLRLYHTFVRIPNSSET